MKPTFGITTQHKSQFEIIGSGPPIIEIMEPWEDKPFVPGSLPLPVNFVERLRIHKTGDRLASDLLLPVRLLRDSLKGGPGEGRAVLAVNSCLPVAYALLRGIGTSFEEIAHPGDPARGGTPGDPLFSQLSAEMTYDLFPPSQQFPPGLGVQIGVGSGGGVLASASATGAPR